MGGAVPVDSPAGAGDGVAEVRAPAELPHAKLRRGRGAKKAADTAAAVGHALDFVFAVPKYTLGAEQYGFWELQPAERDKLAGDLVACMDALPAGKVAKAAKLIGDVAPYVALAGTLYGTVGWRIALTRQLREAHKTQEAQALNRGSGVRSVREDGSGNNAGAGDTGAGAAPGANRGDSDTSSAGVGTPSAALGSTGGLFSAPSHVRAASNGPHVG